jgi:hypothetical protein
MSIRDVARRKAAASEATKVDGERIKRSLSRAPVHEKERWSFGFRFFREIKNFGLDSDQIDKKWPLSMIYRLGELSRITVASVMEGKGLRDGTLRIHDIDWNGKNVPIQRADLNWLDGDYLSNPAEFPLFQIAVSKAEGRLVGFLDEDNVFQVVLLDPLHNAQPTKYHEYKVRLSHPLGCEVTSIRQRASAASAKSKANGCNCWEAIDKALEWNRHTPGMAIVMPVVDGTEIEDADGLISDGIAGSYRDIFAQGLVSLLDKQSTNQV